MRQAGITDAKASDDYRRRESVSHSLRYVSHTVAGQPDQSGQPGRAGRSSQPSQSERSSQPGQLGVAEREASLAALTNGQVDVVVIGGGVTGAGCALDAAARGLSVALLEQNDIAAGTSSRSSKLIHGGLRYLAQWRFGLVREALRERSLIASKLAPHLVHPVPFLYLLERSKAGRLRAWLSGAVRRFYVVAGVTLYDLLARVGVSKDAELPGHRSLSANAAQKLVPALNTDAHRGGVLYWDAQTDDARYTLALARTAAAHGAHVLTSIQVTGIQTSGTQAPGARAPEIAQAAGTTGDLPAVFAIDRETGQELRITARAVINATGVWSDDVESLATGEPSNEPAIDGKPGKPAAKAGPTVRISKGIHLVVERDRIASNAGLVLPTDTSVLFVIPWSADQSASDFTGAAGPEQGRPQSSFSHWIIGTTDTDWKLGRTHPAASRSDIDYLLSEANRVLASPLTQDDVVGVYVGLRPLLADEDPDTSKLSREHSITQPAPGVVSVKGGKYTTYRVMAADAVDAALLGAAIADTSTGTAGISLLGAHSWRQMRLRCDELAGEAGISLAATMHLLGRHGDQTPALIELIKADSSLAQPLVSGCGYLRAEVVHAVRSEAALHLDDVLTRRTRLSVETVDRAVGVATEVAELMAPELGWTTERVREEVRYYSERVSAERASQTHDTDLSASVARLVAADARQHGSRPATNA